MQNNRRLLYIVLALLLVFGMLVWLLRTEPRKVIDWRETYDYDSREPYGTSIIFELLESRYETDSLRMLRDSLRGVLPAEDINGSYLFIGEALYLDTADQNQLLEFVAAGNEAFISSKTLPWRLGERIYQPGCDNEGWVDYESLIDSSVQLNFLHPSLRRDSAFTMDYRSGPGIRPYAWTYLRETYFCEDRGGLTRLGNIDGLLPNFARISHGEGTFYLHTTPIAFSNYQLLEEDGLAYAERALSHLPVDGPVFWDRYSKVPEEIGRRANGGSGRRSLDDKSPLSYILSQPPLAWAWYLLLSMGLLFLLFRAKRRQRIVPTLEPNTNTSMEFLSTIGRLYFLQNNHRQMALQQMKLFLAHVRQRYGIPTQQLDEHFAEQLADKADYPQQQLQRLLTLHQNIESSSFISSNTLVDFHQLIHDFYQQTK